MTKKARIKAKKIGIRGDEVAVLFFSIVGLAFLFISLFRLFAIGKFFDDFIFTFLFGWTKYLAYLFLLILLLPIFFNYYFRVKFTFMLSGFVTLLMTSWLVTNIYLIVHGNNDMWWQKNYFSFKDLNSYYQLWWNSTIIKNYHGFFASPISFGDWGKISTFFPASAVGGIVAYFLVTIGCYGLFITNAILSIILFISALGWLLFSKPWILFLILVIFVKPLSLQWKKSRIKAQHEKKLLKQPVLEAEQEPVVTNTVEPVTSEQQKDIGVKEIPTLTKVVESTQVVKPDSSGQELTVKNILQESSTLTPFGRFKKEQSNSDSTEESK